MLEPAARDLAQADNFAVITTLLPGGQPSTQVMWVDADDDHVMINTEVGRKKFANIQADPRVTVTVMDKANPYHYVEFRGSVTSTIGGDEAREQLERLSHKYTGKPYANPIQTDRVVLVITPERVRIAGA